MPLTRDQFWNFSGIEVLDFNYSILIIPFPLFDFDYYWISIIRFRLFEFDYFSEKNGQNHWMLLPNLNDKWPNQNTL